MATKSLKKLAPNNKQRPGGDPGPFATKVTTANLLTAPSSKLMAGMSASRGKGK